MTNQQTPHRRHDDPREREKWVFRYTSALERGDFETVAAVLHEAERDPALADMIMEVNGVLTPEAQDAPDQADDTWKWTHRLRQRRTLVLIAAAVGVFVLLFAPIISTASPGANYFASPPNVSILKWIFDDFGPLGRAARIEEDERIAVLEVELEEGQAAPEAASQEATSEPPSGIIEVTPLGGPTPTRGDAPEQPAQPQEPMIIKNGELEIVVEDAHLAVQRITQVARDSGGYVLTSQAWQTDTYHSAEMQIAVAVDQFETAMRRIRELADEVLFESASGQDVGGEYVDLQSRLRNLEATRDRIRSFLEQADNVDEALEVNEELARIEAEIEQVQGRMQYLAGRAAFSTIIIRIAESAAPTPTPSVWSLEPRINQATRQQTQIVRGLLEAVTWFLIVPGPYVLVVGLIALVVRAILKRRRSSPPNTTGST